MWMMLESLTARRAASSRLLTGRIFRPAWAIITFASSTFVPFNKKKGKKARKMPHFRHVTQKIPYITS